MRLGSKKIYHLEAWVVKVMSLYKVRGFFLPAERFLMFSLEALRLQYRYVRI